MSLNFVKLDEINFLINFNSFILVLQNNSSHSTIICEHVKNKLFCALGGIRTHDFLHSRRAYIEIH